MRSTKTFRLTINVVIVVVLLALAGRCQVPDQGSPTADRSSKASPVSTVERIASFEQWYKDPKPLVSAHRGGPYPGFPENAIETFQYIADQIPALIECDVSMTKDSVLVLMHDKTLDRTTTGRGDISSLTYESIKDLWLVDNEGDSTSFRIPTLEETLSWGKGKVLFTLDVKRAVPFEKVIDLVDKYEAASYAAIITYRIQDAILIHSLDPELMISVSAGSEGALAQIKQSGIPSARLLGFVGTREPEERHYQRLQALGIKAILGTLGNLDKSAAAKGDDSVYQGYVARGANIIATDRPLEVAKVLNAR